jgi:hypothetical protein
MAGMGMIITIKIAMAAMPMITSVLFEKNANRPVGPVGCAISISGCQYPLLVAFDECLICTFHACIAGRWRGELIDGWLLYDSLKLFDFC